MFLHIAHFVIWLGIRAIAGTPDVFPPDVMYNYEFFYLMMFILGVGLFASIASLVYRGYLLTRCRDFATDVDCDFLVPTGWTIFAFVIILFIVTLIEFIGVYYVLDLLQKEYKRLDPIVERLGLINYWTERKDNQEKLDDLVTSFGLGKINPRLSTNEQLRKRR